MEGKKEEKEGRQREREEGRKGERKEEGNDITINHFRLKGLIILYVLKMQVINCQGL